MSAKKHIAANDSDRVHEQCAVSKNPQVVILGGGFAGIYAVMTLQKVLRKHDCVDITLVNRDNFFLFTPMLHEVAAADLDLTHAVNPIRKLLKRCQFFHGEVQKIDTDSKTVLVSHGLDSAHHHTIKYDHLVLALGSSTNFFQIPGVKEHAFTMRSLGDAIALRNRLIAHMEEADFECVRDDRNRLMSCVVAGGGFAGVETIAGINSFVRESLKFYPHLSPNDIRMVLVHPGKRILPELSEPLGVYAEKKLIEQGVEVHLGTRVKSSTPEGVTLADGTFVPAATLIWTAGNSAHPLLESIAWQKERGRVLVSPDLSVPGFPGVWALGDCAAVPDGHGAFHPPTAQHASRMGIRVARNIAAMLRRKETKPFRFRTLGQLASLGRRCGVAQIFGWRFSGFIAWWLWRTIYLLKLPRLERKIRVAFDWSFDIVFGKDLVQCPTRRGHTTASVVQDQTASNVFPTAPIEQGRIVARS